MLIKDMPVIERPRERLVSEGVSYLSDVELLAIILKSGTLNKSVKDLAYEVIGLIDKSNNVFDLRFNDFIGIKGIGLSKACEVIASIEFGRRVISRSGKKGVKISSADSIFNYCKDLVGVRQEYFYCLYFNNKQELIERKLLFMGTVNKSIVHPREVFKEAYRVSATGIICVHNHPSGDVLPSMEDIRFTNNLVEIGLIQNIPILDHIIIGDNDYYSFYDHDMIKSL